MPLPRGNQYLNWVCILPDFSFLMIFIHIHGIIENIHSNLQFLHFCNWNGNYTCLIGLLERLNGKKKNHIKCYVHCAQHKEKSHSSFKVQLRSQLLHQVYPDYSTAGNFIFFSSEVSSILTGHIIQCLGSWPILQLVNTWGAEIQSQYPSEQLTQGSIQSRYSIN